MAAELPSWTKRFRFWLTDDQYDRLMTDDVPDTDWRWTVRGWIERAGLRALCLTFGHTPVPDQCAIPEHDFCVCCMKPMPGAAHRPPASTERNPQP